MTNFGLNENLKTSFEIDELWITSEKLLNTVVEEILYTFCSNTVFDIFWSKMVGIWNTHLFNLYWWLVFANRKRKGFIFISFFIFYALFFFT